MAQSRIFISYDYDTDRHYKNLLLAWDATSAFDFAVYDDSVDVSVNSDDAASIRRVISARIGSSSHFLCLIRKHTHKSDWLAWEIDKAVEREKKLVAVKIEASNTSPCEILGVCAEWALSLTFDSIRSAIRRA